MVGADVHPPGVGRHVIDPIRHGLALGLDQEVMPRTRAVLACRPPFPAGAVAELPDQLLFLASTLTTGSPVPWMISGLLVDVTELVRPGTGCCLPSRVLALPCRLNPSARRRSATVSALTWCPWRVSSAARTRSDLRVHRSGEHGSPRTSGSTRASSAGRSPGSRSAARLRPPPARRARLSGSSPASSSATPRETVPSRIPAASAATRMPPCSRARASAPATSRRCRSSRCGNSAPNSAKPAPPLPPRLCP